MKALRCVTAFRCVTALRYVTALGALLVAGAAVALPPPGDDGLPQIPCTRRWSAKICASETAVFPSWTEFKNASTSGTPFAAFQIDDEVVDLSISAGLDSGDGAFVAVIDVNALVEANPDVLLPLLAAQSSCSAMGSMTSPECLAAVQAVRDTATLDQIHGSALWGHECKGATDQVSKQIVGERLDGPFLVVAVGEDDSSASIGVSITHHTPQSGTRSVCGPVHSGNVPIQAGSYTNKNVGTIPIDVQPSAGGTLSNVQRVMTETPTLAEGSFSLSTTSLGATANMRFTGEVITCADLRGN